MGGSKQAYKAFASNELYYRGASTPWGSVVIYDRKEKTDGLTRWSMVAYNHDTKPIGVVNSESREIAVTELNHVKTVYDPLTIEWIKTTEEIQVDENLNSTMSGYIPPNSKSNPAHATHP